MRFQELVKSIKNLQPEQRLSLLEILAKSLREDFPSRGKRPSTLSRVRGLLKTERPMPTSKQLADEYTDYLIEKYE